MTIVRSKEKSSEGIEAYLIYVGTKIYMYTVSTEYAKLIKKGLTKESNVTLYQGPGELTFSEIINYTKSPSKKPFKSF
jgi:hypothetical protein